MRYCVILLASISAALALGDSSLGAGFLDNLRQKTQEVKQEFDESREKATDKWKEMEHRCENCGKVIHMGTRCASCEAERVRKTAEQAKENAQQKWKEIEHRCADCDKSIHMGTRCVSCEAKRQQENLRRAGSNLNEVKDKASAQWLSMEHTCQKCGKTIHVGTYCAGCLANTGMDLAKEAHLNERIAETRDRVQRAWDERYNEATARYGQAILAAATDPEARRQVGTAVGIALKVRRQMQEARNEKTLAALRFLGNVSVPTEHGEMAVRDIFREQALKACPGLAGTDFVENPETCITYGLVAQDKKYLFNDLKWINKDGRCCSVKDVLVSSSPLDVDAAMKGLDIMASVETLSNGDASAEETIDAVETLQESIKYFSHHR